jgi:hypothetical protein
MAPSCTRARSSTIQLRLGLTVEIDLQDVPNWAQFVPVLSRVDVSAIARVEATALLRCSLTRPGPVRNQEAPVTGPS